MRSGVWNDPTMIYRLILVTKVGCGICELFKSATWRRLKDSRPNWNYVEQVLHSDSDARLWKMLYKVDQVPHIVVFKVSPDTETHVGDVIGTRRIADLIQEIEAM